jgi:hypothetical protein
MNDCPRMYKKPEFECDANELTDWTGLNVKFVVGEDDYKYDTECYIDVDAGYGSGYALEGSIKMEGEWHTITEFQAIRVVIRGSYERTAFITSLQKVGLMVVPVYGKMRASPEEQDNAIREQT